MSSAERGYVKLSRASIDDLVLRHFPTFDEHGRETMTAISLAESGGVVNVVGDNYESGHQSATSAARYDFGLWQINSQHDFNRTRLLMEPEYNAGAAAEIYERQGFDAWTAYKSERYIEFLSDEEAPEVDPDDPAPEVTAATIAFLSSLSSLYLSYPLDKRGDLLIATSRWLDDQER